MSSLSTFCFVMALLTLSVIQYDMSNYRQTILTVVNVLNVIDMVVDYLVVTLAFSFSERMYYGLCGSCDRSLSKTCLRLAARWRKQKESKKQKNEDEIPAKMTLSLEVRTVSEQQIDE